MPASTETRTGGDPENDRFTVLTANVGTGDPRCLTYYMKLCRKGVEARIARRIQQLRPDVVAIQETLPHWLCARWPVAVPGNTCTDQTGVPQVRRLLGPDYTIICEARNSFECIAVRVDAGEFLGCELGGLGETDRIGRQRDGCRWNVAIMAAAVRIKGQLFDVVNAHPENRSRNAGLPPSGRSLRTPANPAACYAKNRRCSWETSTWIPGGRTT